MLKNPATLDCSLVFTIIYGVSIDFVPKRKQEMQNLQRKEVCDGEHEYYFVRKIKVKAFGPF